MCLIVLVVVDRDVPEAKYLGKAWIIILLHSTEPLKRHDEGKNMRCKEISFCVRSQTFAFPQEKALTYILSLLSVLFFICVFPNQVFGFGHIPNDNNPATYLWWWFHFHGRCPAQHQNCSQIHCPPTETKKITKYGTKKTSDRLSNINMKITLSTSVKMHIEHLPYLLETSFRIGDGAAGSTAGACGEIKVFLHHRQVVSRSQLGLEEQRGTHTAQLPMGDDGNTIPQDISFVHVVGGQDDRAA